MIRWILASAMAPLLAMAAPSVHAQDNAHPAIAGFGAIRPSADEANPPDPSRRYRVIFEITRAAGDPAKVNPALDRVARFVNLLGAAGITPAAGDIVVVVHGPATAVVLVDEAYHERFGTDNPNRDLVKALHAAGVSLHVCSYALANTKVDRAAITSSWSIDVAAMVTIVNLQLDGWVLLEG
ncbi:DsrE family protein [Sphingopyxis sp. R3-92]|uniref:DsrE family protein n=1 Tax=Sphingopyxis sp. R3-92 TaxID=3158553 RepID=UPI003EE749BC